MDIAKYKKIKAAYERPINQSSSWWTQQTSLILIAHCLVTSCWI
ncbi:hypothetical protein VP282E431_P0036 [Vibrio phage 282E43-1]|nr:hypothetical protein VP282E431_P0036 [Vibrio phage 282E43-1]